MNMVTSTPTAKIKANSLVEDRFADLTAQSAIHANTPYSFASSDRSIMPVRKR
jgi:hypothetical protein